MSVISLIWSSNEKESLSFVTSLLKSPFSLTVAGKLKFNGFFLLPLTLDICCCTTKALQRVFFLQNITLSHVLMSQQLLILSIAQTHELSHAKERTCSTFRSGQATVSETVQRNGSICITEMKSYSTCQNEKLQTNGQMHFILTLCPLQIINTLTIFSVPNIILFPTSLPIPTPLYSQC